MNRELLAHLEEEQKWLRNRLSLVTQLIIQMKGIAPASSEIKVREVVYSSEKQ